MTTMENTVRIATLQWNPYPKMEPPKNRPIVVTAQFTANNKTEFIYLVAQYVDTYSKTVFVLDDNMELLVFGKKTAWKRPSQPITHWAEIPEPPKIRATKSGAT